MTHVKQVIAVCDLMAAATHQVLPVLDAGVTDIPEGVWTGYIMSTINILRMLDKQLADTRDALTRDPYR